MTRKQIIAISVTGFVTGALIRIYQIFKNRKSPAIAKTPAQKRTA